MYLCALYVTRPIANSKWITFTSHITTSLAATNALTIMVVFVSDSSHRHNLPVRLQNTSPTPWVTLVYTSLLYNVESGEAFDSNCCFTGSAIFFFSLPISL